jgi:hypothetical protein
MDNLIIESVDKSVTLTIEGFFMDNDVKMSISNKESMIVQNIYFDEKEVEQIVDYLTKSLLEYKENFK